ncbi:MAG: hypothetical protein ACLURV_07990 [Gallintestinimicrobium sp.]
MTDFPWQYFRDVASLHWRYSSGMEKAAGEQLLNLLAKDLKDSRPVSILSEVCYIERK